MNAELLTHLVWNSQMGDENAREELLMQSYSPIFYLSEKILQNKTSASQVTRDVLETISSKLQSLEDPEQFQKWMCRITAARCMQVLPLFQQPDPDLQPETPWTALLSDGESLSETQSARIIQQMVDTLPRNQRLCLLLLSCGGLSVGAIAQLIGFSKPSVMEHLQAGQNTIQKYLWELQERNIQFSGLTSLTGILSIAMFSEEHREDALPVVYGILGKEIPVPPNPEKAIIRTLTIALILLLAANAVAGGYLILKFSGIL